MKQLARSILIAFLGAVAVVAQTPPPAADQPSADKPAVPKAMEKAELDEGIPVTSEAVRKACSACHKVDEKQRMSRISWRRTTPEGWEETLKRMITLNGVKLNPEEAREIVRYLSNDHGLAPDEARAAFFEPERRVIDFKYAADKDTEQTCNKCHSFGRVMLQRRSKSEWELLLAMHRGYYPLIDFQAFRRAAPPQTQPGADGRPPDNRHPMDKALAHLTSAFPLKTAEWSSWAPNMRAAKLEGRWALSGYQTAKGPVYGVVTIRAGSNEDEYITEATYVYGRSGKRLTRSGKAIVYTGFQWRGRSSEPGAGDSWREVMLVEGNRREMNGRWFTGSYDETGIDIKLQRIGSDPIVLGLDRPALHTGSQSLAVTIYGASLPAEPVVDFGPGVKVARVVSASPDMLKVEVNVGDGPVGPRDVIVSGAAKEAAAVVYDKIDGVKVRPRAGMARVGGGNFPKQFQQYEAIAFHNGGDGKPDTKDDLDLGLVDVAWSLEEFTATFGDDDLQFIGALDDSGLFTPSLDGPNPKRSGNRNNVGDVWVVATYTPPATEGKQPRPLRARAHLLVTVPLYIRFEQPEVSP